MEIYESIKKLADVGLSNQEKRETDIATEEGLLKCGICGELRQVYRNIDGQNVLTVRACKCDRFAEAERQKAEREEYNKNRRLELIKYSGMDVRLQNATFENWTINDYNKRNYTLCKSYADRFQEMYVKNQGLLFWGDAGTGKSFAAACIANQVIKDLKPVVMTSTVQIVEDEYKVQSSRLLIIDDLGAERKTDYAVEKVLRVIEERYNARKPMILTTNLTMKQIDEETDMRYKRLYDRIMEMCYAMQFTGPSMRRKEGFNKKTDMERVVGNAGDK